MYFQVLKGDICSKYEAAATWVAVVVHTASQTCLNIYFRVVTRISGNDKQIGC